MGFGNIPFASKMSFHDVAVFDTLHEVLREQARNHPGRVALMRADGRSTVTHEQLLLRVDSLGRQLRASGLRQSDPVAVVSPNGIGMAVAFLGVASAAVCAPLNPAYRSDELEFYLTDLGARAVLVPAGIPHPVREVAARLGLPVLQFAGDPERDSNGFSPAAEFDLVDGPEHVRHARPDDVALLLHTSGTTSRPKLVPLTHRNLMRSADSIAGVLGLTPTDCCLNLMPLFHIHGLVGVLLSSLRAGASVICTTGFAPESLAGWFRTCSPTWYSAVPTLHQSVLTVVRSNPQWTSGGRLRLIRSSSAALPPTLMAELERTLGVPVIESYGMTEAAHQMASNPLPPKVRKPGSVGLPAGPEVAIMDEGGALQGPGIVGELVIRGPTVTSGYCRNPAANETAFTAGWFRTGDLGRKDEDGYLFITGRKKEMINRGGENISPREIDEILLTHPSVAQAVAFAVPHPSLGEDVVAAVVLQDGTEAHESILREFLFERMSDFKVPGRILFVTEIPKGPTGKVQRIGLHRQMAAHLETAYVEPATSVERTLAGFWAELLGTPRVGRDDHFFLLGGDSIQATRLAARVRSTLGMDLAVSEFFRHPTLRAMSARVDREVQAAEEQALLDQLAAVESLSDEDAARLLEGEQRARP